MPSAVDSKKWRICTVSFEKRLLGGMFGLGAAASRIRIDVHNPDGLSQRSIPADRRGPICALGQMVKSRPPVQKAVGRPDFIRRNHPIIERQNGSRSRKNSNNHLINIKFLQPAPSGAVVAWSKG